MSTSRGQAWAAAAYAAMIAGAIGLFLLVRRYGETLSAPAPSVPGRTISGAGPGTEDVLLHLLIALTAVVIVGRLLGRLFAAIGQPPVLGEVIGGVLLGPSLLGRSLPRPISSSCRLRSSRSSASWRSWAWSSTCS